MNSMDRPGVGPYPVLRGEAFRLCAFRRSWPGLAEQGAACASGGSKYVEVDSIAATATTQSSSQSRITSNFWSAVATPRRRKMRYPRENTLSTSDGLDGDGLGRLSSEALAELHPSLD